MYTPLNIKTDNSLLNSLIKVPDLINYALKNNVKSLAIADNNLYGAMDFYMLALKNNIKPIIGLELNIENCIVTLYCKNYLGYQNLIKLNKINTERDITTNDLLIYKDELVCLVSYENYEIYNELKKIYNDIFVTYRNIDEKGKILEKSLYANSILCFNFEDTVCLKYLEALRNDISLNQVKTNYEDNYFKIESELSNEYNLEFEKLCNLDIPLSLDLLPKFQNPDNISSYDYLKKLCIEGLKKRFGDKVSKEYQTRLKHELDVINQMNFCDYFLIVSDYVNYAKDNNIIVGPGRGSAVSSLVAYLLNITDIDPIKNKLLFERFLNIDRISMPDIDIDFEHLKREDVINYCMEKYGKLNVMPILTFSTLGCRQVFRDTSKLFDIEPNLINEASKMLDSNLTLKENLNNEKIMKFIKNNNLEKVFKVSLKLEGLKNHISVHAAGIVMSNKPLEEVIPVINYNDKYITGIDMTYLETIGLLKMDFLAIKYLTIIHEMINTINQNYNLNLTFENIKDDDQKALDIFKNGYTLGIFQFESEGMISFLKKLKPTSMDDVAAAMALYRPGPMKNIDKYIENKNNPEKVKYIVEDLKPILKDTYGILVYQEQIMQIAVNLAGYSQSEADILRKGMSKKKKELLLNEEKNFISGCLKNNISEYDAKKIFDLMLKFAEYGFNKSHSYGYSLVSYKMAYIKANYPQVFYSKILTEEINDKNKIKNYLFELKELGVNVLKPNINISNNYFNINGNDIVYPLTGINGVNIAISNLIFEEQKKGKFKNIYDFIKRCYVKNINRDVLNNLILSSCFDDFGINKKTLIENLDLIINYGELLRDIDDKEDMRPLLKQQEEYENKELLKYEKDLFGVYLSNHPTFSYKGKYKNIVNLLDINNYFDKTINVLVNVDSIKEIMTKKNEKMCFIKGSDETGTIDFTVFPKTYVNLDTILENDIVLIKGHVEKRYSEYQIIVEKLIIVSK